MELSNGKQRFLPSEHLGPGFIKPSCHRNLLVLALFAGKCGWFSRDRRGFGVDQSKLSMFQITLENSWLTCNLIKTATPRIPKKWHLEENQISLSVKYGQVNRLVTCKCLRSKQLLNVHTVILVPLRPTNKNPQRRKIIHGMRPVGRKRSIDRSEHVHL